jgi:hypothetical protein
MQIVSHDKTKFSVVSAGIDMLRGLGPRPVRIISVLGAYRTGKSYLLNHLAGMGGFGVGHTTLGHTQGLWIWGEPTPDKGGCTTLYLDTEGLYDLDGGTKNSVTDSKLAAITVLLSSSIVINSKSSTNSSELASLAGIAKMAERMSFSGAERGGAKAHIMARFFPELWFVLRDCALEWAIPDPKGGKSKVCTPGEYLEWLLTPAKSDSRENADVKSTLSECFPREKRVMIGLPAPHDDPRQIASLKIKDAAKGFKDGVRTLQKMAASLPPKVYLPRALGDSEPQDDKVVQLTGDGLATLLEVLVEQVNRGSDWELDVPSMLRDFDIRLSGIYSDKAVSEYRRLMAEITFPCKAKVVDKAHAAAMAAGSTIIGSSGITGSTAAEMLSKFYMAVAGTTSVEASDSHTARGSSLVAHYRTANLEASRQTCKAAAGRVMERVGSELASVKKAKDLDTPFTKGVKAYEAEAVGPATEECLATLRERMDVLRQTKLSEIEMEERERERIERAHAAKVEAEAREAALIAQEEDRKARERDAAIKKAEAERAMQQQRQVEEAACRNSMYAFTQAGLYGFHQPRYAVYSSYGGYGGYAAYPGNGCGLQ